VNAEFYTGTAHISIGSPDIFSGDVSDMGSLLEELRDTVDANENSRSEARNSSTSSR
jgi:hypothetical protein